MYFFGLSLHIRVFTDALTNFSVSILENCGSKYTSPCNLFGNLEQIVSFLLAKYLEIWSQRYFTDINSGRAGVGILC